MSDKKLTDKEIIKALECCIKDDCINCPMDINQKCLSIYHHALDLINRQKSEIDSAKAKIEICAEVIERQDKEIERLQKKVEELSEVLSDSIRIRYKEAQSEAVKEFAERLKTEIDIRPTHSKKQNECVFFLIDNLVKEMVGEEN